MFDKLLALIFVFIPVGFVVVVLGGMLVRDSEFWSAIFMLGGTIGPFCLFITGLQWLIRHLRDNSVGDKEGRQIIYIIWGFLFMFLFSVGVAICFPKFIDYYQELDHARYIAEMKASLSGGLPPLGFWTRLMIHISDLFAYNAVYEMVYVSGFIYPIVFLVMAIVLWKEYDDWKLLDIRNAERARQKREREEAESPQKE